MRLLVVSPYTKDANSFFRAVGPWSYLAKDCRKSGVKFEFSVAGDDVGSHGVAWDTVGQFDAVFLHRPCREDDLNILKIARNMNVPVWVDYDDWLFDVPSWNPHAGAYHNTGLQNVIAMCMSCADIVSVSTSALYDKVKLVNKNTVIVPNAYRGDLFPYRKRELLPRRPELAWRGTNTHDADVLSVLDGWVTFPGKVQLYGGAPWLLKNRLSTKPGSFGEVGPQDPFLYMKALYLQAPRVLVCPLVDCFFNRCKSNIAYQEALHAGALCVAPDLPEWNRKGIINYEPGNSLSFASAVQQAFTMSDKERDELATAAYQNMLTLYDTCVVNEIRLNTLAAMLSSDFERNECDPWDQLRGLWAMGQLKGTPSQLTQYGLKTAELSKTIPA